MKSAFPAAGSIFASPFRRAKWHVRGLPAVLWPGMVLALLCLEASIARAAQPLLDDRVISVGTARQVNAKRRELIRHVWGEHGFPRHALPSKVVTNIPSPVGGLSNLRRVDELQMVLAPGLEARTYHFIPEKANGELVVVHHGHACTLDDDPAPTDKGYGLQRTIHGLLKEGYGVLGVYMPHMRPGDCAGGHDAMFQIQTTGNPMKFFLEPTALSLNYLKSRHRADGFRRYRDYHMTGLSGGGWSTTVYAAIDPTIRCSFPVAGTLPLYLRYRGSVGDREQFDPGFYGIAGYPDLYVLGSHGRGRKQVQILVRRDDCCFGQAQHDAAAAGGSYDAVIRDYESRVNHVLRRTGSGEFQVEIDDTAPSHMISHHTVRDILLPGLRR